MTVVRQMEVITQWRDDRILSPSGKKYTYRIIQRRRKQSRAGGGGGGQHLEKGTLFYFGKQAEKPNFKK